MPRKGENIRKRNDGRWEGRYFTTDYRSGKKQYHSLYAHSYKEVKEKLLLVKRNLQNRDEILPIYEYTNALCDEKTFGEIAALWLSDTQKKRKYSTFAKYDSIYSKHLIQKLGNTAIAQINSEMIGNLIADQQIKSESVIRSIYCVINQVVEFANKNYYCSIPVVIREKNNFTAKPVEIMKRSEQIRLFEILYENTDLNKLGILMCLYTGLRLGEVCSLKWSDIDINNRLLYVNRTVQRIAVKGQSRKTMLMESDPKSIFSKRVIPLPDELLRLLLRFQSEDEYVISKNRPTEPRTYQNRFQKFLKQGGIIPYNFHVLRHTFATNCIDSGADIKSLSEILGHSSVNITLNRYVHPSVETKRLHLNALSSIYGQYLGQKNL